MTFRTTIVKTMLTILGTLIVWAITIPSDVLGADSEVRTLHHFKMTMTSKMTMDVQGKKQELTSHTEMRYSWGVKARERTLIMDSMLVKAELDGVEMMNVFMSRDKLIQIQKGQTNVVMAETGPERMKSMLYAEFGTPLCKLEVDALGKELKRTNLAGPAARATYVNAMISNAQLFHPPFRRDSSEWTSDSSVSIGYDSFTKGKLNFQKLAGEKPAATYQISGVLENERYQQPNTQLSFKQTRHAVTGEQSYDPNLKEWVSGTLKIDVSQQIEVGEKSIGTTKGTMVITFERLVVGQ